MMKSMRIAKQVLVLVISLLIEALCASECCPLPGKVTPFVEGLYWYTSETSDWAFTLAQKGSDLKTEYRSFHFDWSPGLRVGLKYSIKDSKFDTQMWYTHFESKASERVAGSVTPGFLAARLSLLEPFSFGKATLNVCYNIIDWDLGFNLCMNRHFQFRPAIGLKGGWIDQKIRSDWERLLFENLITASENLTQNFNGIGPKGGLGVTWSIGNCGFSLIGLFDVSYLWGNWQIQDRYIDNLDTVISVKTSPRKYGALMLHSFLGAEWEVSFWCIDVTLRLGYEFENWFNQLQIFTDVSGSQNNNLVLQGVTFRLACPF
ncbi:MAG: Lpg1974 family pore-forming outer membrane protein [Chlamydiota bacterium]